MFCHTGKERFSKRSASKEENSNKDTTTTSIFNVDKEGEGNILKNDLDQVSLSIQSAVSNPDKNNQVNQVDDSAGKIIHEHNIVEIDPAAEEDSESEDSEKSDDDPEHVIAVDQLIEHLVSYMTYLIKIMSSVVPCRRFCFSFSNIK